MTIVWAILFVLALFVCWVLTLLGMPGNWLMAVAAVVYCLFGPTETPVEIGGWVALAAIGLAALGEAIEFATAALGAKQKGGSRRASALALIGSMIGAVVGAIFGVGIPVPILGSLVGSVLLAAVGALVGAMLGEQWKGRDLRKSWEVGHAAFWGRLLGTFGKIVIGSILLAMLVVAVCV